MVSIEIKVEELDKSKDTTNNKNKNNTYVVRRHYNNEHTFEELFAHIIKSHS